MHIRFYQQSEKSAWDEYVMNHPQGTFFHLSGWKNLVEKSFAHKPFYLVAENSGPEPEINNQKTAKKDAKSNIVGLFPLFSIKSFLFGKSMISSPFATFGGILAENEKIRDSLLQKASELTESHKLDYLEIRNETDLLPNLPVKKLYFSFKKEIYPDNDENLMAIPRKTRRMVRLGMKNDLVAEFGKENLLDPFYELFALSYHSFGTPVFSKKYLKNILSEFQENSSILIISKNGNPLSAVLSFYYKDQVIPYYSGASPLSRKYAANDFLYWSLMSDAAEKGYTLFDFGRSKKKTGPYNFKRHWGFEPKPLKYQYYLNNLEEIPNISPANQKYKKRIEMWQKMPLWATKLIGPAIVKNIP